MSNVRILLDPGHTEGYNTGAISSYKEGTKMFYLANFLKEELEKYEGIFVDTTRKNIKDAPSLNTRASQAISGKFDGVISLHTNAASDTSARGVVTYRSVKLPGSVDLATQLNKAICALIKKSVPSHYDRGVIIRKNSSGMDYYGIIRNSIGGNVKYSYIVEHAFHTNKAECEWLNSDSNLKMLAAEEAKVIANYFGCKLKSITPPVNNDMYYITYVVKPGESFYSIAKEHMGYGDKFPELVAFNNMRVSDVIHAGDQIKIPMKYIPGPPTSVDYTVKEGDSWWRIAMTQMGNGDKCAELAKFNGKTTHHTIHTGDILKIPK